MLDAPRSEVLVRLALHRLPALAPEPSLVCLDRKGRTQLDDTVLALNELDLCTRLIEVVTLGNASSRANGDPVTELCSAWRSGRCVLAGQSPRLRSVADAYSTSRTHPAKLLAAGVLAVAPLQQPVVVEWRLRSNGRGDLAGIQHQSRRGECPHHPDGIVVSPPSTVMQAPLM
ncbi:MAG: hypothetical protein JWM85_2107 [Acidimicrobiaceae bacterium]|nr:hypothetical protein [Acidimicrobiaceae bacterium]